MPAARDIEIEPAAEPTTVDAPLSPTCVSPEAVDERLEHYVLLFGSRWSVIKIHMQAQFARAFPARYLEERWNELQVAREASAREAAITPIKPEVRSPLAERMLPGSCGIQERLPLQALPKTKRWREEGYASPIQPNRPPPPPSPRTLPAGLPKGLKQGLCPTFLLAPGSSLAAPDNVRRQLKAVYLASLLSARGAENSDGVNGADVPMAEVGNACAGDEGNEGETSAEIVAAAEAELMAADEAVEAPGSPFASDDEKHQIVALLARELAGLKRKAGGGGKATEAATAKGKANSHSSSSSWSSCKGNVAELSVPGAHRSGATGHAAHDGGNAPPPPLQTTVLRSGLGRRWPKTIR